jgi:hypothetical protein
MINKSNKGSMVKKWLCNSNSFAACSCSISHNDQSAASKTIDDKRHYPKPVVASKNKQKMYYYKKQKLSKGENDFHGYLQHAKNKESGEYSLNQNATQDSAGVPISTKQRYSAKANKGIHKKSDSLLSVSFQKPKIWSKVTSSFVPQKSLHGKADYSSSVNIKHQRRSSETQFQNQMSVKYEPLQKYKHLEKPSPKTKPNTKTNSRSFYIVGNDNTINTGNLKSFSTKDHNLIPNTLVNMHKSASKKCKKTKAVVSK